MLRSACYLITNIKYCLPYVHISAIFPWCCWWTCTLIIYHMLKLIHQMLLKMEVIRYLRESFYLIVKSWHSQKWRDIYRVNNNNERRYSTWCLKKDYVIFQINIHALHYSMVFKIAVAAKICYVHIASIYMCCSIWCWTGAVRHVMTNPTVHFTKWGIIHKNISTSLITMIFR